MDTTAPEKDFSWFFGEFWPTVVVALLIYGGGRTAEQIAMAIWPQTRDVVTGKVLTLDPKLPALFRIWWSTRYAHPFLVGAAISFIPGLPAPEFVTSHTSGVLWFGGFAGGGNGQISMLVQGATNQANKVVDMIVPWVRQKLGLPSVTVAPPSPAPARDPMPSTDATALPADAMSADAMSDKIESDPPPPPEAA